MARVTYRDFSQGLWLAGPRDVIPARSLRRATGVRPFTRTGAAIRSRWGHTTIGTASASISQIFRFHNQRYVHAGNDVLLLSGAAFSLIDFFTTLAPGARLRAASAIPTLETDATVYPKGPEHLFVAGTMNVNDGATEGGSRTPFKINTKGEVSAWGILPDDTNTLKAAANTAEKIVIWSFDIGFADTPAEDPTKAAVSGNSVNYQEGNQSTQVAVLQNVFGSVSFLKRVNLLTFIPAGETKSDQSVGEDCIQLWVWVDRPENLDFLEIIFDVTLGTVPADKAQTTEGLNDTFSYVAVVDDVVITTDAFTGVTDDPRFEEVRRDDGTRNNQFESNQETLPASKRRAKFGGINDIGKRLGIADAASIQIVEKLSTNKISSKGSTWTKLRIPKKLFTTSGKAVQGHALPGERSWGNVRRVRFGIKTNDIGSVNMLFDEMSLQIGEGISGTYDYAVTYKNSNTGSRSNPSKIVTVKDVDRQSVTISGSAITLPSANANRVELWRTLGNGSMLFKVDEFDPRALNPSGVYIDRVADFPGVQENPASVILSRNTRYLQDEALPFDNEAPSRLTRDVAGPYLGSLWLLDGTLGKRGNLYYTPPGRMESVQDFLVVTGDDDPLQRVIMWNGIFVWSEERVYGVEGTNPYIVREIFGIPGTNDPQSIIVTPYGVAYRASDGVRLFNGSSAALIAPDAVTPIFNRETVTSVVGAFGTTVAAAYHNEEYILSDSSSTYAVNLRTSVWRNCGYLTTALLGEKDTGELVGGRGTILSLLEKPGVTSDNGVGIAFDVEVPGVILEDQSSLTKIVQRVYFDLNTGGQNLTGTLLYTGSLGTLALGTITTASREMIEIALGIPGDIVGVRLTGTLVQPVEIAGIAYDVHLPEQGGQLT